MTREIVKNSFCIIYTNELEEFHHEDDKPSFIGFSGTIYFDKKGKDHRKGKPSVVYPDGSLSYWQDDKVVKQVYV